MDQLPETSKWDHFESFIQYIEKIGKIELSDSVRLDNKNIYSMLIRLSEDDLQYKIELNKRYEIIKTAKHWWIDDTIVTYSAKIKTWEYNVVPQFSRPYESEETEKELEWIGIIKRKDKINLLKQWIKKLTEKLVPSNTCTE